MQREISLRTSAAHFVGSTPARLFRIRIERFGEQYAGTLDISGGGEPSAHRQIEGEVCETVAVVLAIAAVLAIDPEADTTPTARFAEPAPPTATAVSPSPKPRLHTRAPLPELVQPLPRPHTPGPSWDLGASLAATGGVAPVTLITPAPFLELEWQERDAWAPLVRAQPLYAETGFLGAEVEEARFSWYALRLAVCPLRAWLVTSLQLRPCVVLDGGLVRAEGVEITKPGTETRPWVTLGPEARLRWDATEALFVETALGFKLAPARYRYVFEVPRREIYQTPWVAPAAEVGLGVRFL